MNVLVLTQAQREELSAKVAETGWPAGLGIHGTRVTHGERGEMTFSEEELGQEAFRALCALSNAGPTEPAKKKQH